MDYSIIIPHKNSSKLLKRLLKSIPQAIHVQVIVVDDNSTKEEILEIEKLQLVFNFEFYSNEGKTAGGARNTGLQHADGKWIIFADADDYFENGFLEQILTYKDVNADIIFFPVTSKYSESGMPAYRGNHVNMLHEKYKATGNDDYLRCCHLAPWAKMIRKSLIIENDIRFEECIAGNDNWFSVNTGIQAQKVIIADVPIYCITVSSGSLTTTLSKGRFEAKLQSSLRTNRYLRQHKKSKYQISVLYFLAGAYQFGIEYLFHVVFACIRMRANPFIGISKILHPYKALSNRQNKKYIKDDRHE